jgi:hypothetical protein
MYNLYLQCYEHLRRLRSFGRDAGVFSAPERLCYVSLWWKHVLRLLSKQWKELIVPVVAEVRILQNVEIKKSPRLKGFTVENFGWHIILRSIEVNLVRMTWFRDPHDPTVLWFPLCKQRTTAHDLFWTRDANVVHLDIALEWRYPQQISSKINNMNLAELYARWKWSCTNKTVVKTRHRDGKIKFRG